MNSEYVSSNKRARIHNDERANNRSSNQAISLAINHSNGMLRYPFVIPIIVQYLDDRDVLCMLLLIVRSMQHLLAGYHVQQTVSYEVYETIVNTVRYLPVRVNKVKDVAKLPLVASALITHVEMHERFNEPLTADIFPIRLTYLKFGDYFKHPIPPGVLPNTLQHLHFHRHSCFNQPLVLGSLPQSLTCLKLGSSFMQQLPIGVLPISLTSLGVRCYDRVALHAGPLLTNLKSLLGMCVRRASFDVGMLPPSLETLEADVSMVKNEFCPGVFPCSLKHLTLWYCKKPLDPGVIPYNLMTLTLNGYDKPFGIGVFPDTLLELCITGQLARNMSVGVLPCCLKRLSLDVDAYFEPGALPAGLEQLSVVRMLQQPYDRDLELSEQPRLPYIPEERPPEDERWDPPPVNAIVPPWLVGCHLADLSLTINPSQLVPGVFSLSVRCLDLTIRPDLSDVVDVSKLEYDGWTETPFALTLLPGVIPFAVNKLKLHWYYARNYCLLSGSLSASVKSIVLYNCVPSPNFLPSSVTHIEVGKCLWNQLITVLARVPSSVTHLTLSGYLCPNPDHYPFVEEIDHEYRDKGERRAQCPIPASVKHLYIDPCYNRYVQFLTLPPHLVALHVGRKFPKHLQLPFDVARFFSQSCAGRGM